MTIRNLMTKWWPFKEQNRRTAKKESHRSDTSKRKQAEAFFGDMPLSALLAR